MWIYKTVLILVQLIEFGLCGSETYYITSPYSPFESSSDMTPPSNPVCLNYVPNDLRRRSDNDDDQWGGRIIAGQSASPGQFPYLVSFRELNVHNCGGFILSSRWIGSAGHCFPNASPSGKTAVVGTNSLLNGGTVYNLEIIIIHPYYDSNVISNDISMVKTTSDIEFNSLVQPIPLDDGYTGGDVNVITAGFGWTTSPGIASINLMWTGLRTITNEQCSKIFYSPFSSYIMDGSLCIFKYVQTGVCHGDSGGALVANDKVVGIVSWGMDCSMSCPDVFTRISYYKDWILEQMQN